MASATLPGALKGDFGEAVMAREVLEPCEFASLDSCQKTFLRAHKKVDLAPHHVVGLIPPIRKCGVDHYGTWSRMPGSFFSKSASHPPLLLRVDY